jgi:2-deoxy-D-gluconate 3-dehydrogenase
MKRFDLTGRVAVVTGANTGIGQAIAVALAEAGADVAVVGRTRADDTVARIMERGRRAHDIEADLSTLAPIGFILAQTQALLGPADILVNNAGIIRRADAIDFNEADWDAVIDTNLKSLYFLSQAFARSMLARGRGKIINIASLLSF